MKSWKIWFLIVSLSLVVSSCADDDDEKKKDSAAPTYVVGVTVSGLSGSLVLLNNGDSANALTISKDGSSAFTKEIDKDGTYNVTIKSEPSTQVCDVANGYGIATADVNLTVKCAASTATLRKDFAVTTVGVCKACHPQQFEKWEQSGHGYKMNKVESSTVPVYPFSSISKMLPDAGRDLTYTTSTGTTVTNAVSKSTVSYIIGGYGWKGRYFDKDGYLMYGSNVQYNIWDETFGGYNNKKDTKDGTENGKVEYKCGFCHTTGWKAISGDAKNSGTKAQDDLKGMKGSWDFSGVTCQRCHGTLSSGSNVVGAVGHNTKLMAANIYDPDNYTVGEGGPSFGKLAATDKANNVCADCHVRSDYVNKVDVDTDKGLLKHHEQSQELYVGRHGNPGSTAAAGNGDLACTTCHDPHASVKYDDKAKGEGVYKNRVVSGNCAISCHSQDAAKSSETLVSTSKVITVNAAYKNHTCVDCHMPRIVSSAIAIPAAGSGSSSYGKTPVTGVTALGIPNTDNKRGDMRSHIFAIAATSNADFMKSATLDGTSSQVKIPVDFSCMTCHGKGGSKGPTTAAEAATQLSTTKVH